MSSWNIWLRLPADWRADLFELLLCSGVVRLFRLSHRKGIGQILVFDSVDDLAAADISGYLIRHAGAGECAEPVFQLPLIDSHFPPSVLQSHEISSAQSDISLYRSVRFWAAAEIASRPFRADRTTTVKSSVSPKPSLAMSWRLARPVRRRNRMTGFSFFVPQM